MLENQSIICISNTTWHGPYTKSTVQLLSRLGRNNKILFIEYPHTVKDVITTWMGKQRAPVAQMLGFKRRLVKELLPGGAEIHRLIVPPVLPFDVKPEWLFRLLNRVSVLIYRSSARKAIRQLRMQDTIVITAFNPFYGLPLLGQFNEKLNVYYCYDGTDTQKHGQRAYAVERRYCEKTDAIIVTSDHLLEIRKQFNQNCVVVKNGVEYDAFQPFAAASAIRKIPVRIGYVGSIDYRFDTTSVLYAIENRPEWQFEFTGDIRNQEAYQVLIAKRNVKFHPPVKPQEVPEIMVGFSAGIIPYLKDDINKNIYPLKINEYLALGIPVVMTDFASLPEFSGLISVADSSKSFLTALEHEIITDSEAKRAERIEMARANSWEERTKIFADYLEEFLAEKQNKYQSTGRKV